VDRHLLAIYLNDHLTAATAGVELVKRARGSNKGTELGDFLLDLENDLEDDLAELKTAMTRFGVKLDHAKQLAGWTGEKLGRFKLNGQLLGYSPLSRVVELESLMLIVDWNAAMWRSLGELDERYSVLADRADRRRTEIEDHRADAVAEALNLAASG
jgi:hypothetical protein